MMRHSDIKSGFHLLRDGNKWMAIGPEFVEVDKCITGFGDTPEEAVANWRLGWAQKPWFCDGHLPELAEFIRHDNDNKSGTGRKTQRTR